MLNKHPLKLALIGFAALFVLQAAFLGLYWAYFNREVKTPEPKDAVQAPLSFELRRRSKHSKGD